MPPPALSFSYVTYSVPPRFWMLYGVKPAGRFGSVKENPSRAGWNAAS
jgi:hypothetical protein